MATTVICINKFNAEERTFGTGIIPSRLAPFIRIGLAVLVFLVGRHWLENGNETWGLIVLCIGIGSGLFGGLWNVFQMRKARAIK